MSKEEAEGGEKAGGMAWVRWVVVGVIVLAFMVMFRDEIKQLLGRTEELSVSKSGITIKARTTQTPIGETVVSNLPALKPAAGGSPAGPPPSYAGPEFEMTWPQTGAWIRDDAVGARFGARLFVRYRESFGNFTPNVNVTVEQIGSVTLPEWLEIGNQAFAQLGWQLVSSEIDEASGGGVRVLVNRNVPGGLYQIQRVLLRGGRAYVATASKIEADAAAFPRLYEEMRDILNSFRLVG